MRAVRFDNGGATIPQPQQRNGQTAQNGHQQPRDQLDLYNSVVDSTAVDPFLDRQNLGLGNYKDPEMWQQVESYRHGLYASAAFRRLIDERATRETQIEIAINGYEYTIPDTTQQRQMKGWEQLEPDERRELWVDELRQNEAEPFDRRRWIKRRGEQLFEELQKDTREEAHRFPASEAIQEIAGHSGTWDPAHNQMLMARHETSRSRGAQLLDNVFGRVKEHVASGDAPARGGGRR